MVISLRRVYTDTIMKKRLFIAIKLNETTLSALRSFQKELKQQLQCKGIRWVNPDLFHLTLQFLGDTDVTQIPRLITHLESAALKIEPFNLIFEGTGFFGSSNSVRAIWAGTQPSPSLQNVFFEVVHSTEFLPLDQQPRFSPHLTLARGSDWLSREDSATIVATITERKEQFFGVTEVASFELIESILNSGGPVYKTVKQIDLV